MSMLRSKRSRKSSARCSISRGSTPARCGRNSSASASTKCCASSRSSSRRWRARRASNSRSCPARLAVRSDRRLLRRLLQNLVSNAIKYTPKGRVLVGCRRRGKARCASTSTTPASASRNRRGAMIFREFHRLDEGAKVARGLGLGLSIVERIGARARSQDRTAIGSQAAARVSSVDGAALKRGADRAAAARESTRRSQPTLRHHGAMHRQRALGARRHGDAARRLGLPGAQGPGPRDRALPRSPKAI